MGQSTIRRTYKYQLYRTKKTEYLDAEIELARQIWNHCLALQKRYYRIYGKYISANRMKVFVTRLRRNKYSEWQDLGSQAVQDVGVRQRLGPASIHRSSRSTGSIILLL